MIPIGDTDVKGAGFPLVTVALIAINVLVFLYQIMLGPGQLESFYQRFAVIPADILQGENLLALLTSMFLHGGWFHLISNMVFLWIFGDNIEAALGKPLFLGFYLAGGLAASVAHILVNSGSTIPSLGASGAIAAVLGAYLIMFPHSRIRLFVFTGRTGGVTRVTALMFIGIWAVSQLFNGIASLGPETAQTGGVAFWAHIGGFVFGLLVSLLFRGRSPQLASG